MTQTPAILTRYVALDADFGSELGGARTWLTGAEHAELARFRHPLRRRQWLAGRWVSKQLIAETLGDVDLSDIQILTRDGRGLGARPVVCVRGERLDGSLSISHTERGVLVALSTTGEYSLGVDLTGHVPCDERFQTLWFTAAEQRWIDSDLRRAALTWSIKEAVYKACHTGQGWSPRLVEVEALAAGHYACLFAGQAVEELQLSIEEVDSQTAVIAAVPAPSWAPAVEAEETNNVELMLASCL